MNGDNNNNLLSITGPVLKIKHSSFPTVKADSDSVPSLLLFLFLFQFRFQIQFLVLKFLNLYPVNSTGFNHSFKHFLWKGLRMKFDR